MLSCLDLSPRSDERQIAPLDLVSRARATSIQNVSGRALILKGFYSASTVNKVLFFTIATAKTDTSIQNKPGPPRKSQENSP